MGKVTEREMSLFWKMYWAIQSLGGNISEHKEERYKKIVLGRAMQLEDCGGMGRIIGCLDELLTSVCDPDLSYLDFKPEIKAQFDELKVHQEDLKLAAGELMVDIPEPGTVIAQLLRANSIMRRERDSAKEQIRTLFERVSGQSVHDYDADAINWLADMIEGELDASEGAIQRLLGKDKSDGNQSVDLKEWLESGSHLPKPLREFEQQAELIKYMHSVYRGSPQADYMPNTMFGHVYAIDWFLWFMASRGYTLQKATDNIDFKPLPGEE